jgi:hypothetical protein
MDSERGREVSLRKVKVTMEEQNIETGLADRATATVRNLRIGKNKGLWQREGKREGGVG